MFEHIQDAFLNSLIPLGLASSFIWDSCSTWDLSLHSPRQCCVFPWKYLFSWEHKFSWWIKCLWEKKWESGTRSVPFPESDHRAGNSRYYSLGCMTLCLALLSQTGDPAPWGTLPGPPKRLYRRRERRRCLELARWPERFVNPWPVCDQSWKLSLTKCQMTLAGRLVISDQALAGLYLITANWVIFYLSSLLKSLSQTLPFELVSWRRPQLLLSLSSCEWFHQQWKFRSFHLFVVKSKFIRELLAINHFPLIWIGSFWLYNLCSITPCRGSTWQSPWSPNTE